MTGPAARMSDRRRLMLGFACLAAGCLAAARPAQAHAALVRSEPSRRAVLTQPPSQIRLWFSERIEPDYSAIAVVDAAGKTIPAGPAAVSPTDAKLLILDLPPLAPGVYTVRYRINSIDGHILDSSFQFMLKAATGDE